ncbi:coiled-coil domain-containing protein 93 isoform X2 [Anthonomus grandis grandis]|uniref:coiled-coil domain-containing protein 93 isoform X2 n=1 Tax=Anthonomus grandis grandis TaxID=2921223 RepID=UPI0021669B47|nr:coiled-coil domain-containing protein 93 isoform X2 [Anthonomus grandis grandis]
MAKVNQDLLQKFQRAALAPIRQEGDGHEIKVDVREDEEQSIKHQEIIDLLVAAGYFRARIKGLSPFDKIVGGMIWCIESLSVDVDVDLLFQENSTIGQKIALTEKIVAVLPKIQCPHRIEPHQIQGLDFIHIFPVIQWLVKVSLEARQEKSEFVRSYAVSQYDKMFPSKDLTVNDNKNVRRNLDTVEEVYRPHRYFKRKNVPPPDILSRVQITLLEYGFRGGNKIRKSEEDQKEGETSTESLQEEQDELHTEELTEEDKLLLMKHYSSLCSDLKDGGLKSKEAQQLATLEEQNKLLDENISQLQLKKSKLQDELESEGKLLEEIRMKQKKANEALKEFSEEEQNNPSAIKEIKDLVILNDSLKAQEVSFKENCKRELVKLQSEIEDLKKLHLPVVFTPEQLKEIEELSETIRGVRLKLAKKNQIISKLQRQLDDIPNRAEMTQYQRRFLELYNQVAAKHKETKQYFSLYNTLDDKRRYMQKELSLLNSVIESYPKAMLSAAGKEEFLKQFQNIVDSVKQNRTKIDQQLLEEKKKRDEVANSLQNLLELQRTYANAVKQLTAECKKYETLLAGKNNNIEN